MMSAALLVFAAALTFAEPEADLAYATACGLVTNCTPRDAGTPGGEKAAEWIRAELTRAGVKSERDDFGKGFHNLYVHFEKGPDAPWVVLVSHYDTKPGVACPGANDGASTSGLLMALAGVLSRGYAGRANVMLAWLDGEECRTAYGAEDGLWGSRHLARWLKESGKDVRAVVCLDMLGDRNLDVMVPANGSPTLMKIAKAAGVRAGVPVALRAVYLRDDHMPFLEAGYAAIDLIDFEYGSAPGRNDWWHTPQDTTDKLSRDSLLRAGRLVTELLDILTQ